VVNSLSPGFLGFSVLPIHHFIKGAFVALYLTADSQNPAQVANEKKEC